MVLHQFLSEVTVQAEDWQWDLKMEYRQLGLRSGFFLRNIDLIRPTQLQYWYFQSSTREKVVCNTIDGRLNYETVGSYKGEHKD